MNAEELKQLKKGDEIFIRAKYKKIDADGDVLFLHSNTNVYDEVIETESFTHPRNVILPPSAPKHDPCRLFKKWDIVKKRSVFGREIYIDDCLYEVMSKESCNKISIKKLNSDETLVGMMSVFFELVTPVEEMGPYVVSNDDTEYSVFDRFRKRAVCLFDICHPHAKEAAEAECARLNAEYRKEANNGLGH